MATGSSTPLSPKSAATTTLARRAVERTQSARFGKEGSSTPPGQIPSMRELTKSASMTKLDIAKIEAANSTLKTDIVVAAAPSPKKEEEEPESPTISTRRGTRLSRIAAKVSNFVRSPPSPAPARSSSDSSSSSASSSVAPPPQSDRTHDSEEGEGDSSRKEKKTKKEKKAKKKEKKKSSPPPPPQPSTPKMPVKNTCAPPLEPQESIFRPFSVAGHVKHHAAMIQNIPDTLVGDSNVHNFKVTLVGDSGVGKTSISVRLRERLYNANAMKSTIGVDFITLYFRVEDEYVKMMVWDTAGQERYRAISAIYYRGVDALAVVFDITKRETFQNIHPYIEECQTHSANPMILILANKSDLIVNRQVRFEESVAFAQAHSFLLSETSALNGTNVDDSFIALAEILFHTKRQKKKGANSTAAAKKETIFLGAAIESAFPDSKVPPLTSFPEEEEDPPKKSCSC